MESRQEPWVGLCLLLLRALRVAPAFKLVALNAWLCTMPRADFRESRAGSIEPKSVDGFMSDGVCVCDVTSDVVFPVSVPGNSTPNWIVLVSQRPYALLGGDKMAGVPAREELTTGSFRGSSSPLVEPLRGGSQGSS